jgi:predicted ATP-dependent endonuclease of OLD family
VGSSECAALAAGAVPQFVGKRHNRNAHPPITRATTMLLKHIALVGMHGALNLEVPFNSDITLLVGINGSGKTSLLNAINVLLLPDMRKLAVLQYERLSLSFEEKGVDYTLTATKNASLVELVLSSVGLSLKPITIDLQEHIDPEDDEATERYATLGPEAHERPLWDLLKSFSRPTVISLDRTITAASDEALYFEGIRTSSNRRARTRTPLSYVQEVTSVKYAEYRAKAIANDNELKAQIVISALQDPELILDGHSFKAMNEIEITKLEEKVVSYLSGTIKSGNVTQQVRSFFRSSRLLTQRMHSVKGEKSFILDFVISRYYQIDALAKAFNDFDKQNSEAFRKLNLYLETVNKFFNDSSKELYFDESTGQLVFSFLRSGERTTAKRAITHLSSGERQVLILFTFLAFAATPENVFIVDEPELSLHPKWQHEFMDAFLKLRPAGTQLLLATHSPDIVGKHKGSCVTLRGRVQ